MSSPQSSIAIDFALAPLDRVVPWGNPPKLSLHWFGLSDGWYAIRACDVALLSYSEQMLQQLSGRSECWYQGPHVDYQLARLHEDLLDLFPAAISPVPDDVAAFLRSRTLLAAISDLCAATNNLDLGDPLTEQVEPAMAFYQSVHLDTLYLVQGQGIVFWSAGDDLIVEWDSREPEPEAPRWTAGRGTCLIPRNDFIAAVSTFHASLMEQMEQRVRWLESNGGLPGVEIDLPTLRADHERRKRGLDEAIAKGPVERDWDAVRTAIRNIGSV